MRQAVLTSRTVARLRTQSMRSSYAIVGKTICEKHSLGLNPRGKATLNGCSFWRLRRQIEEF